MDETKPRRRWYRKKRWWAAVVVFAFPFFYELSSGPGIYFSARRWPPGWKETYHAIYPPLFRAEFYLDHWTGGGGPDKGHGISRFAFVYRMWWFDLAVKHMGEPKR